MKLYWMESMDHDEDWFVVASNVRDANQFFSDYMGYDIVGDEIVALEVCSVPESKIGNNEIRFADEDVILACGGVMKLFDDRDLKDFLDAEALQSLGAETRVVMIKNCIYVEGNIIRSALHGIKNRSN
jgi:Cys-tRNA synthase (O-phospho-L-seryl-tRNA:Cys-tRNA synthase)